MTSIWDRLGLDGPTEDLRTIKKAYAKKLKSTRPDDDPEAFMALRDALEMAQHHARYAQMESVEYEVLRDAIADVQPAPTSPEHDEKPSTQDNIFSETEAATDTISAEPVIPSPASQVIDDVHKLMLDPFGRTDVKRWSALFNDERLDAIDDMNDFEDALLHYFLDNFGYFDGDTKRFNINRTPRPINPTVATHIFNEMGWRDSLNRPLYLQDQLNWLRRDMDVLDQARPISTNPDVDTNYDVSGWAVFAVVLGVLIFGRFLAEALSNLQ